MGIGMGSSEKSNSSKTALHCLLLLVALALGIGAGFIGGYLVKDCVDDESSNETTVDNWEPAVVPIYNHAPGKCDLVKGLDVGSEDMVALSSGLVIITAGLTAFLPPDRADLLSRKGSLMLFDFNDPESGAADIPVANVDEFELYDHFNPMGISKYIDEVTGRVYLFVVNHNYPDDDKETIEKFEFDEANRELTWLESISDDDNMIIANDVIATGPNTFYYTNFFASRVREEYLQEGAEGRLSGGIGYYDGQNVTLLFDGLRTPNGITVSLDGKYAYVATGDHHLSTYKIGDDNGLTLYKRYLIHTDVDNFDFDTEGYLWVTCHPDNPQLFAYLGDPNVIPTPSQTLRLTMEDGELVDMLEVYKDDGNTFSAAAVAVHYEDKLLMGSVYTKALLCDIEYLPSDD